ncbi:MAG: hypothetical protein IKB33_00980 [Spirochaetaceae bacterium]|nr:hypothetical protein [Spirochaetaceae bacterium]
MKKISKSAGWSFSVARAPWSDCFFLLACTLFFCSLNLSGCSKKAGIIDLSQAPLLPVDSQWGVVIDPYAIYRKEPNLSAPVAGYGRRGAVQEIVGQRIVTEEKKQVIWYQFSSGWLPETAIQVYSNELKAQSAANELNAARDSSH